MLELVGRCCCFLGNSCIILTFSNPPLDDKQVLQLLLLDADAFDEEKLLLLELVQLNMPFEVDVGVLELFVSDLDKI